MQYDEHVWAWRSHRMHLRGFLTFCWERGWMTRPVHFHCP